MYRVLEKGVESGFQDDQINLSNVTALIKKSKGLDVIIPSASDPLYEDNLSLVYTVIPPDHYWTINCRAEVVTDPLNCSTAPALDTASLPEWTAIVPFPAPNASAPYYVNIAISSSALGPLYTVPSEVAAGFNSTNSKYVLVMNILEYFYKHSSVKVYWERYRDVYYKDSLIFVSSATMGTVSITGTGLTTSQAASSQVVYSTYNRGAIASLTSKQVKIAPVKLTEEDALYPSLQQNFLYKTDPAEPVADQLHDFYLVYRDGSFLVTRLFTDYIRKPRTISLLLNQHCELGDTTHPKIVDLAVELLRLDTKDQSYPQTVQDTQLRTT
jgi:hypothetical protein